MYDAALHGRHYLTHHALAPSLPLFILPPFSSLPHPPSVQVPSPVVKWRQRCRFAIEVTEPQHPEAGSAVASVRPAGVAAGGGRAELWVLPDKDGIVRAPLHAFTRGKSGNAAVAAVAAVAAGAEVSTPAQVRMKTLEGNAQVRLVITQREPRPSNMNGAGAAVTDTGGDAGVSSSANGSGNGSGGGGTDADEMDDVPAGDGDVDGDESSYIKPCYVDNGFPIASEVRSTKPTPPTNIEFTRVPWWEAVHPVSVLSSRLQATSVRLC